MTTRTIRPTTVTLAAGADVLAVLMFTHRLPLTFVLVAAVSLAVLLLGWRVVALFVARSRGQSA